MNSDDPEKEEDKRLRLKLGEAEVLAELERMVRNEIPAVEDTED